MSDTVPSGAEGSSNDATYIRVCCSCMLRKATSMSDDLSRRPSRELPDDGFWSLPRVVTNLPIGVVGRRDLRYEIQSR